MYDESIVQRFIDLRVQGWSFARIALELKVSKPTLVDWSRKHQHTIANLSAIEREARVCQVLASSEERIRQLGEQLRSAESELAKRDLTTVSTGRLLTYIQSLRSQLQREAGSMQFSSTADDIPEDEYADRIQVWNP